ncbi:hypothetical protein M513_12427 [Trichuris suis]|uniref:Uncharacterized protein n=1 Tax=Trichuris suis TaxID=68888 RepID=A0A085LP21_9BILA|nr:hypothetical protein M513_12427 [Trichuris suis]
MTGRTRLTTQDGVSKEELTDEAPLCGSFSSVSSCLNPHLEKRLVTLLHCCNGAHWSNQCVTDRTLRLTFGVNLRMNSERPATRKASRKEVKRSKAIMTIQKKVELLDFAFI